jgi:hypothetical protein
LLGLASAAHARTDLLVYSALEADQIKAYKAAFEKAHPEIELKFVRDSTGIITARLLAEKANPQADVIWGVAATSLMLLDKQGMLQPYAPRNLARVRSTMRDAAATPTWVGMDLWSSAVCFNTVEGRKRKLPACQLGRPDQARIQGRDHHAPPGVQRHRLSDGGRLAADDGRGQGLGLYGCAAPEHRRLHAQWLQALPPGRRGRVSRGPEL